MSTMKSYGRKKQNWKTAKRLSNTKKWVSAYRPADGWSVKGSAVCQIPGSTSGCVVVRNSSPHSHSVVVRNSSPCSHSVVVRDSVSRSHSVVYEILSSQESRELDNAMFTLRTCLKTFDK